MLARHFAVGSLTVALFIASLTAQRVRGDEKEKKIDINAIKKATREALPEKTRDKVDLSYITEEFVRKMIRKAKPAEKGRRNEKGEDVTAAAQNSVDYGNHPIVKEGKFYYEQGDSGSVESYACGRKYTKSITVLHVTDAGLCSMDYHYYKFEY